MGSWGRAEVTAGSDDDFMVLVLGSGREDVRPSIDDVKTVLDRAPGDQGIFGNPVGSDRLIGEIGLEEDTNSNLSRGRARWVSLASGTAQALRTRADSLCYIVTFATE